MARPQVLVLGAINQDEIVRVADRPQPGETVVSEAVEFSFGGKGANQAHAAALQGATVQMVGAVGDDTAGRDALASLSTVGVNVSLVRTVVGVPTGRAYVTVSEDGQNSIVVALGANAYVSPSAVPTRTLAGVLVAQTEVGVAPVRAMARLADSSGARLVLNDGPVIALGRDTLASADPLIVNEQEASALLGSSGSDPRERARALRDATSARSVIVTLGARGAVIADAVGERIHPGVAAPDVVDTTGAGDVFVGTFAAAIAAGDDDDAAIRRAGTAATAAVAWREARAPVTTTRASGPPLRTITRTPLRPTTR
jgi:ribokinase